MPKDFEFSAELPHAVREVHTALTDERYWRWRMKDSDRSVVVIDKPYGPETLRVTVTDRTDLADLPAIVRVARIACQSPRDRAAAGSGSPMSSWTILTGDTRPTAAALPTTRRRWPVGSAAGEDVTVVCPPSRFGRSDGTVRIVTLPDQWRREPERARSSARRHTLDAYPRAVRSECVRTPGRKPRLVPRAQTARRSRRHRRARDVPRAVFLLRLEPPAA